jgi:PHD-finger/PHD-like zinc-binding domain
LDILKTFPLVQSPLTNETDAEGSDLLQELVAKQQQVSALETGIEPSLRRLLNMVVEERMEYESAHAIGKRNAERRVLEENRQMLERRRAKDLEEQERLENDMDAVCSICLDGEVTPTNQILFCDTCNVAVHQYCYGIDRVPEGDYFCLACRDDNEQPTIDGAAYALATAARGAGNTSPRAIVCELCPLKIGAGAFVQTQYVPQDTEDEATTARKWVHVVCAKWLGLNFVDNDKPDLVEDVTDLKRAFRVNNIKCELCQGERGCMNRCRHENCEKWLHVTCARASKTCEVVHGEDCHGDVEQNPWTLACPEHSEIPAEDVPKDATSITELIEMAKALPPEPAPLPAKIIPFNKAKGHERKRLLADPEYERLLLIELTTKITATHFVGVRCQVCDQLFDVNTTGKDLTKCSVCLVYFCPTCKLDVDDEVAGNYKCPSCQFVAKTNAGEEHRPSCVACYCKNGPLRPGVAKPVKMTHWNKHPKEFERSLYAKNKLWVHSLCAL